MRYSWFERISFRVIGKFVSFLRDKKNLPRIICLDCFGKSVLIKIPKFLRNAQYHDWQPGMKIQIWGTQKVSKNIIKLRLSTYRIAIQESLSRLENVTPQASIKPACIQVCGKSGCMKRGGKQICKALEHSLAEGEWQSDVKLQMIGCLGKCSQGPHVIVKPDRKRYTQVKPKDIPQVLARHFSCDRAMTSMVS